MEDKKIVLLKHHPMNVKFTNSWYKNQVEDDLKDYVIINVTSRVIRDKAFMNDHPTFNKDISPFFLGPVVASDGMECQVFEHFWQVSKVFPCHYVNGKLTPDYFKWRKEWFDKERVSDKTASRRPHSVLGYKDSDCLFSIYYENGKYLHLDYVQARKKIYIPEYAKLVVNTESFKWIKSLYDSGKKIALVDFDGYNYYYKKAKEKLFNSYLNKCQKGGYKPTQTLNDYLNINTINDVINCGFTPAGHGFIIKMLLEGDIEVIDGKVIDHTGVLKI